MQCDISNIAEVDLLCRELALFEKIEVIYLAAYHNPDLVEKNLQMVWNINITSLPYFINKLQNVKCMFYPSTDSVYGDSINGYHFKESDSLNPVNSYCRQKCVAESIVRWHGNNVVRYSFIIKPSLSTVKKHFYDMFVGSLTNREKIEIFTDSFRSYMSFDTGVALVMW